ncbi:insulin-like growth factor I, adult form [Diprion similis]|uniref:insulin-like growth factor I, adult form n=1 Tax=Diprion similis TaxID=362088 RepID=UPI001EF9514A|nr:insulin-like growth factor I, adult form [Diprion similis]
MSNGRTTTRRATGTPTMALVLLALTVLLQLLLMAHQSEARPSYTPLRLCSRSLSDALYLVCKDRGFNEPFSYSGEDNDEEESRPVTNTGSRRLSLVQECCHRYCTLEHLERYCKPAQPTRREDPASQGNSIHGSQRPQTPFKIVSLPYSSVKEMPIAKDSLASIAARVSRRKRRKKARQKHAKACLCHGPKRRKQRIRTRWRKVSRETVIPLVPAFQVGTTSPEPIDSIVIFPFKSELSLGRINGPVMGPEKKDHLRRSR